MKAEKLLPTYVRLRQEPLWRLLASVHGPVVIALLEAHLASEENALPASVFHERIERDLEQLRAEGMDFPQAAQVYVANWLLDGFVERRFPAGVSEEVYELSTAASEAIRFVSGMIQPHSAATASRLGIVIRDLVRLAEETDPDDDRRIDTLMAKRLQIDRQIEAILKGDLTVLEEEAALERTREIVSLASDLAGDFRKVRDQFEQLNRDLRAQLLNDDGRRGDVLDSLFAGIDLIAESEAGRTFSAFWRLLIDPEQAATLETALDGLLSRDFVARLDPQARKFLRHMTTHLLDQGGQVHEVLQTFARSLKHFVQSREYLEQRRLHQLLRETQRAALDLKDEVRTTEILQYSLELTSSHVESYSQWQLYDPSLQAAAAPMCDGGVPVIDLDAIGGLVAQSEIDLRQLKANIYEVLLRHTQASIGQILAQFPAMQGLGSVVGLILLGSRHGYKLEHYETVAWVGADACRRSARIPAIYFLQEKAHELV